LVVRADSQEGQLDHELGPVPNFQKVSEVECMRKRDSWAVGAEWSHWMFLDDKTNDGVAKFH